MARATRVNKAQKNYPEHGIKKGETYWWWKFKNSSKQYSKTPPRGSQLTQSDFMGQVLGFEEEIEDLTGDMDREDIRSVVENVISGLQDLASEQEDKKSNMPDSLQDSDTGQLLEGRAEAANEMASEFEQVDLDGDDLESIVEELQQITYGGE